MQNFNELGLPEGLNHTLQHMQFIKPTPIQAQAIPHALLGKDILGSAETGTGKTGAFGIPLVARLLSNPQGSALVVTPTRELAAQVMNQLQTMLGKRSKIKTALLIGGDSMFKQLQQLRNHPRLFVGTPGRINDHLENGNLKLNDTNFLVLDETDRMLDMGFTIQIEKILKFMPKQRQTMLFSATLPKNIVQIAEKYLNNPVRVAVNTKSVAAANIEHEIVRVSEADKLIRLVAELDKRDGSILIFMKTKYSTEKMSTKLAQAGHSVNAIHGDLHQSKRNRLIADFRNKKYRILVATDVASRGLDIPHIEHVINYDLPQCAEDYIHRIGRTARAGAKGSAICLITPSDIRQWNIINRLMNPDAPSIKSDRPKPHKGKMRKFIERKIKKNDDNKKSFGKKKKVYKAQR